jgi:hypothetical protein
VENDGSIAGEEREVSSMDQSSILEGNRQSE